VFYPLFSSSEVAGVSEDSKFPLLGVWVSSSHFAQSGVATFSFYYKLSPSGHVTTYIPFPTPVAIASSSSSEEKHGLYLYQEGGKKMDSQLHLVKLWGMHFFFILGDGGSRK
jgi:hypothetical protein